MKKARVKSALPPPVLPTLFDVDALKQCGEGIRQGHLLALIHTAPEFKVVWFEVADILDANHFLTTTGDTININNRQWQRLINITTSLGSNLATAIKEHWDKRAGENLSIVKQYLSPFTKSTN